MENTKTYEEKIKQGLRNTTIVDLIKIFRKENIYVKSL